MTTDPKHEKMIQHHGPVHSEPHSGSHAGTTYEGTDASVKIVLGSLAIIALTLVITAVITLPIDNILKTANPTGNLPSPLSPARVIPQAPLIEVRPWNALPELRAHEESILTSSGTDAQGRSHIPIAQAMDAVVSQFKIRPTSPEGVMVPGGQGRDFAGSLKAMPPPYQSTVPEPSPAAMIQGEIHKQGAKQKNAPQQ